MRYWRARISATWRSVPSESTTGTSSTRLTPWSARKTLSGPSPGTITVAPGADGLAGRGAERLEQSLGVGVGAHDVGELGGHLPDRPDQLVQPVGAQVAAQLRLERADEVDDADRRAQRRAAMSTEVCPNATTGMSTSERHSS